MTPVMVTAPPDSVASPMPPFTVVGARSPTSPVIVPADVEVTVTFAVAAVPCVMGVGDVEPFTVRVVVVAWNLPAASGHFGARVATVTGPRAVAQAGPGGGVCAGGGGLGGTSRTALGTGGVLVGL